MKNIVFLDKSTFPKKVNFPKFKFKNKFNGYDFTESSQLISRIRKAHVIITNKIKLSGKDLSKAPNLELIAITATGTNIIDLEYCKKIIFLFAILESTPQQLLQNTCLL